jgi:nucleoside-diphosphate-sugar epimerase
MTPQESTGIFLTGGTGFLGSHIGAELLRRGEKVFYLVRGNHRISADVRLAGILDWHGVDRTLRANASLIEGDLSRPGLRMNPQVLREVGLIIHCASDTSFSERNRRRVWNANVESLKGLLDFAVRSHIPSFIDISTAYVAGRRNGPCPEEVVNERDFFNVYEESKASAEQMILDRCRDDGIRATILRPSIVYGDSRTGRTFRFNALYYPVKTALFLQKIFTEDIKKRGGEKASEAKVVVEPDGTTRLPLRIEICENSGVNLIPVDFFVKAFFAVMENSPDGGIYHIVNPRQTKIEDIIDYAQNQFKLKGIWASAPEEFHKTPRTSLERLFERYLEAYSPYMRDKRIFLTEKVNPILKRHRVECPEFDENMFRRCMTYAVKNDWVGLSI